MPGYILCTSPRSGSTLLCNLLTGAGAGRPDSFLMADPAPEWRAAWGLPPEGDERDPDHAAAVLQALRRAGTADATGIFGMRLMQSDLPRLLTLARAAHPDAAGDPAALDAAFGAPVLLHLWRRDRLAQAVSLVKAAQTGLWHRAPDGTEIERLAPPAEPVYDAGAIAREKARLARAEAGWARWFRACGLAPVSLAYEDLAADIDGTLARVCAGIGLPASASRSGPADPGVAILSDEVNRAWIARFRGDAVAPG